MDAPTTASADNSGSGGNGGNWGWFSPAGRKQSADEASPGGDQEPVRPSVSERESRAERESESLSAETAAKPAPAEERHRPAHDRVPRQSRSSAQVATVAQPRESSQPPAVALASAVVNSAAHASASTVPAGGPAPLRRQPAQPQPAPPSGSGGHTSYGPSGGAPGPVSGSGRGGPPSIPGPQSGGTLSPARQSPLAPQAPPAPEAPEPSPDAILLRRTMAEIEPIADKVTSYFYALLFIQHPDLRALFPAAMDTQRDRLFKALIAAATHVDDAETLTAYLSNLGRGHRKYGTRPEHYPAVGECLLGALSRYATRSWDAETEAAWVRAYTAVSQIMIDAAAEDEQHAPAWWSAEVVSHDLRTSDIAVVTVRPDQPYPFKAGQYAMLETPWWPRVWRHYSFSAAPRPDGLLSFHVKAVPAGWVSGALVHRARPGDVLRLGPPGGSMTVDHGADNGLLCLGGGTGIAPIKALVEDVAEHGRKRPVEVFYGARRDYDLYDIDTMLRLARSHPWLSVRPVVADGPAPAGGLRGPLPEAVRSYGPWHAYDAYLSGPPGMIRSGIDTLTDVGVPADRIRHDALEELIATGPEGF
ncbi:globin domain-containing protein [Streptomyces pathocidini]|uniref:globin domain-containing protein n=1 Tax=Streptomyces pathocidini TaxID=1650571 RepID=UPI0033EF047C